MFTNGRRCPRRFVPLAMSGMAHGKTYIFFKLTRDPGRLLSDALPPNHRTRAALKTGRLERARAGLANPVRHPETYREVAADASDGLRRGRSPRAQARASHR